MLMMGPAKSRSADRPRKHGASPHFVLSRNNPGDSRPVLS